jgi:hypothetical protein
MSRPALAFVMAVAACTDIENSSAIDPASKLDETVFKCTVEPILARQCSYTACHGIAGTALRVYTPGKLRAAPAANIDALIAPLTADEEHANFTSAAGFSLDVAPTDNFLLRKPLPSSAGGFEHKGGAIYKGTNDSQYTAILAWLSGTGACP